MDPGFVLGALDVASVNILKYADKNSNEGVRLLGSALGGWQYYYFSQGLGEGSVIKRNIIWDIISDVLVAISGTLLWNETLSNRQMVGIALSLVGIYLLQ